MPTIRIPNPGIDETVIHPSVVAIVDQVLEALRLKKVVQDIRYTSYSGDFRVPHSGITDKDSNYATFAGSNRIWVEVDTDKDPNLWSTSRPDVADAHPYFFDQNLGVSLIPFMTQVVSKIKIRFTSHNRDSARQTYESLTSRLGALKEGIQHTVNYAVAPHPLVLQLLNDVWIRRELTAGYGQDFVPYVREHSSMQLAEVFDKMDENHELVYKSRLGRVNGRFVLGQLPDKPTYEADGSVWEFMVEYTTNFDVPSELIVDYPIMVHNEYMPGEYLEILHDKRDIRDAPFKLSKSQAVAMLTEFGRHQELGLVQDRWIKIPHFDDWIPEITPRDTATVFSALLRASGEDEQLLFNLRDLGTFNIAKEVLDFIQEEDYGNITQIYKSFFYIHLYAGNEMLDGEALRCDKDLNIYATKALDPRVLNRVRFSMVVDINLLNSEVKDRIWKHKKCLASVITAINEKVRDHSEFFNRFAMRNWEPWMLNPVWAVLTGIRPTTSLGDEAAVDYLLQGYRPDNKIIGQPTLPPGFSIPEDYVKEIRNSYQGPRMVQLGYIIEAKENPCQ